MKYCLRYKREKEMLMNSADELLIKYDKKDTNLPEFMEQYKDKRIIIVVENEKDFIESNGILKIKALIESGKGYNLSVKLLNIDNDLISQLKENNISFFLDTYVFDWDTFTYISGLGVSDIYITESLGFELDRIGEMAHKKGINVRVFPNVAQSKWNDLSGIKKFFIRPEDTEYYEQYVDIYEFFGEVSKEGVLYEIYKESKEWFGDLSEIIIDLNEELDSRFILPSFGECRVNCGKRCLKGYPCCICDRVLETSKTLKENGLKLKKIDEEEEE